MSSWNSLPQEILRSIFLEIAGEYTRGSSQAQVLRCASICRGWKLAAQTVIYQKLELFETKSIEDIIIAFEGKERTVGKSVKSLCLFTLINEKKVYEEYLDHLVTMFPYIEKIATCRVCAAFYENLVHIGLDGKWKFLKQLEGGGGGGKGAMYVSCALTYKNSLTHVDIGENCDSWSGIQHSAKQSVKQYNRVVSQLESFPNFESWNLYKTSNERLQNFDSVIEKCPKLTSFTIEVDNEDFGTRKLPSATGSSRINQRPNIKSITGHIIIDDDSTLEYIMQKFHKLDRLD